MIPLILGALALGGAVLGVGAGAAGVADMNEAKEIGDRDASKFQEVALLVKALAEIMKTPVLDNEGQLNPASRTIQAKYRTLGGN
ncbi:hypothetical protein [Tolypothrix sp. VBCCA 56010]|uniref:hypothetical protein n=1 Tax=Tolypothrix sp. VBCCA 56010 TaxID=3137731 RepID=UPI003D7F10DF